MSIIPPQSTFPPCPPQRPGGWGPSGPPPASEEKPWATRYELSTACRCGHPHAAHEHYRPGSECGQCGCGRWRRAHGKGQVRYHPFADGANTAANRDLYPHADRVQAHDRRDSASGGGRTAAA